MHAESRSAHSPASPWERDYLVVVPCNCSMARWQCVAAATLLTLALPPGLLPAGAPCPAETEALLTLRAALSPAEGGVLGDWTGDVCGSSGTAWSGVVADNGRVLAINLSNLGLSGMIPESLFTAITSLTVRRTLLRIEFVFTMQAGSVRDDAIQPCRPFHISMHSCKMTVLSATHDAGGDIRSGSHLLNCPTHAGPQNVGQQPLGDAVAARRSPLPPAQLGPEP